MICKFRAYFYHSRETTVYIEREYKVIRLVTRRHDELKEICLSYHRRNIVLRLWSYLRANSAMT